MLLYRVAPEGYYAVAEPGSATPLEALRLLYSDPLTVPPGQWELGRKLDAPPAALLPPIVPGKLVGIGRNYREHAREMNNPVPTEPLLFLKSPGSLIGPNVPVVLPPESEKVEYEGEIAIVLSGPLRRATADEARRAVLGVTCANDVTARDLQRKDATFARAKSFDTFCPLGPAIHVGADLEDLEVVTRVDGQERQRGHTREMVFGLVELLVYASRMMTLFPGDVVLTGTPAGTKPIKDGEVMEVEVSGVGVLRNPVEAWKGR